MKKTIHWIDDKVADKFLSPAAEEEGLLLFLIHGLFQSNEEMESCALDPQQGITVDMLRRLIGYFLEESYKFVSPDEVVVGLRARGKYVQLTFDDGYFNNVRALQVLEEFEVPAVFYISSGHVQGNKAFWWDVIYRESRKRAQGDEKTRSAVAGYKQRKTAEVEHDLRQDYGENALRPVSDLDRPFSPSELRDLSNHKHVFLGNHTKDHAILTNYSGEEIEQQIRGAQAEILAMTGKLPQTIAYPNGNETRQIRQIAQNAGLRYGVGVASGQNRLPLGGGSEAMALKRFTLWGDRSIEEQCLTSRSRISIYHFLQRMKATTKSSPSSLRPA